MGNCGEWAPYILIVISKSSSFKSNAPRLPSEFQKPETVFCQFQALKHNLTRVIKHTYWVKLVKQKVSKDVAACLGPIRDNDVGVRHGTTTVSLFATEQKTLGAVCLTETSLSQTLSYIISSEHLAGTYCYSCV